MRRCISGVPHRINTRFEATRVRSTPQAPEIHIKLKLVHSISSLCLEFHLIREICILYNISSSCRRVVHHPAKLFVVPLVCIACSAYGGFHGNAVTVLVRVPRLFRALAWISNILQFRLQLIHQQKTNRSEIIIFELGIHFLKQSMKFEKRFMCLLPSVSPAETSGASVPSPEFYLPAILIVIIHCPGCAVAVWWRAVRSGTKNRIHVGLSKSCVVRCIVKCKRVSFNQWRWE